METAFTINPKGNPKGAAPQATDAEASEPSLQSGDASHARWLLRLFRLFVRLMMRLLFRVEIEGLENVPGTPVIICANHLGWTETFLVMAFFPLEPRVYVLGEKQVAY